MAFLDSKASLIKKVGCSIYVDFSGEAADKSGLVVELSEVWLVSITVSKFDCCAKFADFFEEGKNGFDGDADLRRSGDTDFFASISLCEAAWISSDFGEGTEGTDKGASNRFRFLFSEKFSLFWPSLSIMGFGTGCIILCRGDETV